MERRKIKDICLTCISLAALIILWIIVSNSKPDFFPTPQATWERFVKMAERPISRTTITGHILISLKRVLSALILAVVSGIGIGLIMGWSKKVNAVLSPILTALRPIPPIAWIPLVILWFGVGEFSKVLLVFIGAFFPVVLNTATGVSMVDPMYLNVGRVYNANTFQMLRHVVMPAALPAVMAGVKIALSSGWMVVVAAEMIASKSGLGFLITRGNESYDVALVLCGMILIGLVGAVLSAVFTLMERWLCPWTEKKNG
ncbi:MAG: ABC transporter permease [Blautia marasmi]